MKRVLITGVTGQLGYDILKALEGRDVVCMSPTSKEMDITDSTVVSKVVKTFKPDVIFHCAAYTAVDKAEDEKDICYKVNVLGTKNIVNSAREVGAKVVYISTDYVFDGTKDGIYTEEDTPHPINHYGYTKYLGEEEIKILNDYLIVRISWVFGLNGKNFVKTMLRLAETKDEINVVSDQVGSPTYTKDLAKLLVSMVDKGKRGTFNATNEGYCSWYDFAKYIFEVNNIKMKVHPILTKDYQTVATRPLNSRLDKDKLDREGLERLPSWQDATKRYCRSLRKED